MSIYYNGVINNMDTKEIIIPELNKEELKEIARSKKSTAQIWATNKDELNSIMMSQNVTSSLGGTRKLSYAFTKQGIYVNDSIKR